MVPTVDWRAYLMNSASMTAIDELTGAKSRVLTLGLNRPGTFNFTINGQLSVAQKIAELSTAVLLYRNGVPIWSGPVMTTSDGEDDTCQVSCSGWFEYMNHRILKCGTAAPASMPTTTATTHSYTGSATQTLTITGQPTSGTFILTYLGQTTSALNWNAQASDIQTALGALSTIGAANVQVSGGPLPNNLVTILLLGTAAGGSPQTQALITSTSSLVGGTSPTIAMAQGYVGVDAGLITFDLLARTNAEWPVSLVQGSFQPSTARIRNYNQDMNLGQEITTLTNLDSGFDFTVDPISRAFNIWFTQVLPGSRVYGYGQNRPNALFTFPGNLKKIRRTGDGTKVCNQMTAIGQYGRAVWPPQSSIPSGSIAPLNALFESAQSLSDVVDPAVLSAYAVEETVVLGYPEVIYSLSPKPITRDGVHIPRFFDDYFIGDVVYLAAKRARFKVPANGSEPAPVRCFGATVNIGDGGDESIDPIVTTMQGVSQ